MVYAAYSSNTNVASGSSSPPLALGATTQDPFTLTLRDIIIRVPSQEHLNRLTAWLCRMSGAQASALNTLISTTFIAPEGLIDSF
ncbi:MAG TPA: hypothetical protein VFV43_00455, partial [Limnobacter sp.]|nr:hypothetical protein [Limnobacter sp.]